MGLADARPETARVKVNGVENGLEVRGLSLDDLTPLVAAYLPEIESAVELYRDLNGGALEGDTVQRFVAQFVLKVPGLAAEVISAGAGEPDMVEHARRLPFSVQAQCLSEIARLTFAEVGGLGNLSAILTEQVRLMQKSSLTSESPSRVKL